jgi:hypothetical protein
MVDEHKLKRAGKSPWLDETNEAEKMFEESEF